MGVIIELNKMALDRLLWNNALKAKWVLGWFAFNTAFFQGYYLRNVLLNEDVYGMDGNGGSMLKIITNLTDEEMARLKYVRRLYWHWNGSRKMSQSSGLESISDQELADRGIKVEQEPYVEYVKRPPHDKYL